METNNIFDIIIVGVGPAGMTASIYASRYKLSNLVIGKTLGGEFSLASKVENYPGFLSIPGIELNEKISQQVQSLGAKIIYKEIGKITKLEQGFEVEINGNEKYQAKTLIVATGSERRRLNIPGEKEYNGRGVSYCTTCDAPFYKAKAVAIIGGCDAAVTGAIHTAEFANQVYIIYRGDKLRAEPVWMEDLQGLLSSGKVKVIYKTNLTEIIGDETTKTVKAVKLDNPYEGKDTIDLQGVFIEIGGVPGTALITPLGVDIDESGHVKVTDWMETNIPGLFCAGDMIDKSKIMKQAITAMAFGAVAAGSAYKFLKGQQAPQIMGTGR